MPAGVASGHELEATPVAINAITQQRITTMVAARKQSRTKPAAEITGRTRLIINKGQGPEGEEGIITFAAFKKLNPDDTDLLSEIQILLPGQVIKGGGGAAPEFTIELATDAEVPARKAKAKKNAQPKNIHFRVEATGGSRCGRNTGTRVSDFKDVTCGYCKNLGHKTMDEVATEAAIAKKSVEKLCPCNETIPVALQVDQVCPKDGLRQTKASAPECPECGANLTQECATCRGVGYHQDGCKQIGTCTEEHATAKPSPIWNAPADDQGSGETTREVIEARFELVASTKMKIAELYEEYRALGLELPEGAHAALKAIANAPSEELAQEHAEKAYRKAEIHLFANWKRIAGPDTPERNEAKSKKLNQLADLLERKGDMKKATKVREAAKAAKEGKAPTPKATRAKVAKEGGRDPRLPKAGTVLEKEYKGKGYKVEVLSEGFKFHGKTYPSLSAVSNEITGNSTNGFLFWGLIKQERKAGV